MKIDSKQIFEFVGFMAVVLSVLFLAYELGQSNQIARTVTRIELANNYAALNESIYTNPEVAELLAKSKTGTDFQPTPSEIQQLSALAIRFNNIWQSVEIAYLNGQYSEVDFQGAMEDARNATIRYPGLMPYWVNFIESHPTQTTTYQIWGVVKDEIEKAKSAKSKE